MTDPSTGDRAKALHDLAETRGWTELHAVYDEQRAAYVRRLGNDLLRKGAEIDQRDIDYHAGFFDAWRQILAQPDKAEKRFEKEALRETRGPS